MNCNRNCLDIHIHNFFKIISSIVACSLWGDRDLDHGGGSNPDTWHSSVSNELGFISHFMYKLCVFV